MQRWAISDFGAGAVVAQGGWASPEKSSRGRCGGSPGSGTKSAARAVQKFAPIRTPRAWSRTKIGATDRLEGRQRRLPRANIGAGCANFRARIPARSARFGTKFRTTLAPDLGALLGDSPTARLEDAHEGWPPSRSSEQPWRAMGSQRLVVATLGMIALTVEIVLNCAAISGANSSSTWPASDVGPSFDTMVMPSQRCPRLQV